MATTAISPKANSATEETKPAPALLDRVVSETEKRYLPVMAIETAVARSAEIKKLKDLVLVEGKDGEGDYGVIPGTKKPTLYKAGAEKINSFFGYVPVYSILEGSIEDWTGKDHNGEPLFYYHVNCVLVRDDNAVGAGSGSCNSWESKYRYRNGGRECPKCHQTGYLIKGNPAFERNEAYKKRGSWICHAKQGGCGEKFFGDDPAINEQVVKKIANDQIFDLVNTVRKMADKRAYIAATLTATGASQYFTQDMEDITPGVQDGGSRTAQEEVIRQKTGGTAGGTATATATEGTGSRRAPVVTGAAPEDPDELKDTLLKFTRGDDEWRRDVFAQLVEAIKTDRDGGQKFVDEVLQQFGSDHPLKLPLAEQQACIRALWLTYARIIGATA